jgi:hypothetical protein
MHSIKFIFSNYYYSEKATKFEIISLLVLTYQIQMLLKVLVPVSKDNQRDKVHIHTLVRRPEN